MTNKPLLSNSVAAYEIDLFLAKHAERAMIVRLQDIGFTADTINFLTRETIGVGARNPVERSPIPSMLRAEYCIIRILEPELENGYATPE